MLAAAAAWDGLAAELQSTAAAYSSVIATLTTGDWVGPSSLAMAAAITPYLTWMQATGAQAAQAATQATAAATAYETAFAATVPPTEVAANRSQLASLVASNIFGQNTQAIAITETQYAEMWAQDAVAMDGYTDSSAAAVNVEPFTEPPQTTNAAGLAAQAAAAGQVASGSAQSLTDTVTAEASQIIQTFSNLGTSINNTGNSLLNSLFGAGAGALYTNVYNVIKVPLGFTTGYNDIGLLINFPVSQFLKFAPKGSALGAIPRDALGAGLVPHWGRGTLFSAVQGGMNNAGTLVGKLSVPPAWAANTPAIRMVASALSAAGPDAVPAAALGEGGLLSSMSLAGMLGSAMGAGAPTVAAGSGVRGRIKPLKDLKDSHSPEKLQRLVAQISEKPESVQHHTVDQEGLDSLLEQLSKKPGIHAVHLSKGDKSKVVPSDARLG
jgi:PPE-repeat protein